MRQVQPSLLDNWASSISQETISLPQPSSAPKGLPKPAGLGGERVRPAEGCMQVVGGGLLARKYHVVCA